MPRLVRRIAAFLPARPSVRLARRLIARADAARDRGAHRVAAALYEEVLRLRPRQARLMIQCGHMLKEAGDLHAAERQYLAALALRPDDPDLALQLGHFYKVADQIGEAQQSYARALALRPAWAEARDELARLGVTEPDIGGEDGAALLPELLPRPAIPPEPPKTGIVFFRLGARRVAGLGGLRVLRGVEAIRGACVVQGDIERLELLLDGVAIADAPVRSTPLPGAAAGQRRFVFNVWHDFSHLPPGRRQMQFRFLGSDSHEVLHTRQIVLVDAPLDEAAYPASDAVVSPAEGDLETGIDARPSMVRHARRSVLGGPARAVLVQRYDQLGDLVVSEPALRRLRALLPEARLVGLLSPGNAALGRTLGLFDDIVEVVLPEEPDDGRRTLDAAAQRALRHELARFDFDVAIDLIDSAASRALLKLSGARFLYGLNNREAPWFSAGLETHSRDPMNELENTPISGKLLALVERLGAMLASPASAIPLPETDRALLAPFSLDRGERFLLLHLGARLAFKRWPHFNVLARILLDRTDLAVVIFADDQAAVDALGPDLPREPRIRIVTGGLPFAQFDALLSFAAVMVGNDSGPKHLAAFRGTKVVSLHLARHNWNEWGQEGQGRIISRRVPCAGCAIVNEGDCGRDFVCLTRIRPEEVAEVVIGLIGAGEAQSR